MPQMMPINWLFLFMLFTIIFMLFNMMNYYSFLYSTPKSTQNFNSILTKSMNWKW